MAEQVPVVHNQSKDPSLAFHLASLTPNQRDFSKLWELPSDHVPIGARIGNISVGSWNVLNRAYLHHFARNEQGLASSILIKDNVPLETSDSITVREEKTLLLALEALSHLDVLLLQECSSAFLNELTLRRPRHWEIVRGRSSASENDICALLNTHTVTFDREKSEIVENGYPLCKAEIPALRRPVMNLFLSNKNAAAEQLRIIHTHVPGDPQLPGIKDLVAYAAPYTQNSTPLLVAGDLNFPEADLANEVSSQGLKHFRNLHQGNTILGNDRMPKQIDHLLLFGEVPDARSLPAGIFGRACEQTSLLLSNGL